MSAQRHFRIGQVLRVLGALMASQDEVDPSLYLRLSDLRIYSTDPKALSANPLQYAASRTLWLTPRSHCLQTNG